ncbi:Aconitase A [Microbacterium sp. 8M]|nr:Aconitase A [Microbacterium sp. 8M]
MSDNGPMADPVLAPRSPFVGLVVTWAVAAVAAILIGIFAPAALLMTWYVIGFGLCVLLSFTVQLSRGETRGFILRVSAGCLGALLVMGVISAGFGIAALFGA